MTSYWDFVQMAMKAKAAGTSPFDEGFHFYNSLYDNSHGSDRYWLSKFPVYSWIRRLQDEAKQAQDTYDNTRTDPAYIDRIRGNDGSSIFGSVGNGIVKMARSLESVYSPEVVENVSLKFNNMYT